MESITVKDYRCFHEEQTARLAPLTLLVGENSTGKTSFMAMIWALCDLAYGDILPDFQSEPYDLGSFDEIAYKSTKAKQAETFEGGFSFYSKGEMGKTKPKTEYHYTAIFGNRGSSPIPVERSIFDKNTDQFISIEYVDEQNAKYCFGTSEGKWEIKMPLKSRDIPVRYRNNRASSFYELFDYLETNNINGGYEFDILRGNQEPSKEDFAMIQDFWQNFEMMKSPPYASAPVRSKPRRDYKPIRAVTDPEGYFTPMYLNSLFLDDKREWENLKNAIENFGVEAGLFDEITIQMLESRESGRFKILVRKFSTKGRKGPWHNLIDVGYGVSQTLPVITELLSSDAPEMFLLQQPEVHLHPSAQAALGSLFCRMATEGKQLIVETHSDHLIDRIRMNVRDDFRDLKPDDVSILYFERDGMEVKIYSLGIDRDGNILNAPSSYRQFFMEETNRSLGL